MRYRPASLWRRVGTVLLVVAVATAVNAQETWTITDLGTLGGLFGDAEDINDAGQIVGEASPVAGGDHAFLWTPEGGMIDLGTLGGTRSEARAINNVGQVAGNADRAGGFGDSARAFLWTAAGGMIDLGTLGEISPGFSFSGANDINEAGHVVGVTSTPAGSHAFRWTPATGMVDLGTLGGLNSVAHSINNVGQIVGRSDTASGAEHAFLWTAADGMVDLGTLGGSTSDALDINNVGQVVGRAATASGAERAFLWTAAGGMADLGTLGGADTRSQAHGINDAGQVVGLVNDGDDHAFYWTAAGGMVPLPTLSGIESAARAINSAGQIAGYGDIATGDAHAVAWNAASNPPTPGQLIDALETSIQDLVAAGSLTPNQADALKRPLLNAERSLAGGQPRLACFQVFQFQVAVTRLILFRALTLRQGVALIEAASDIRTALGC